MMRFKELRGLGLGLLLLCMDVVLVATNLHEKLKLVAGLFFGLIIMISLTSQYYVKILNDCIFLYRMAGIVLIPGIVDFKDIKEIKLKSKHHLIIRTEIKKYHVYVFNAQKLEETIRNKMEEL